MSVKRVTVVGVAFLACLLLCSSAEAKKKKKDSEAPKDPYAELVWPPPPNQPRIKLEAVLHGRADIEGGDSKLQKILVGATPRRKYDLLAKPIGVSFDPQGRVLVTDWKLGAILRFDLPGERLDVLGTTSAVSLVQPMGMTVSPDGTIYIADVKVKKIIALNAEGEFVAAYGGPGDLSNPTDVTLSPEGDQVFVSDSKDHRIVIFDRSSGKKIGEFGEKGTEDDQLAYPSALAFDSAGDLLVVDQINSRVQVYSREGEHLDQMGGLGTGFGNFVRPKDIAVDENGLIYVTDTAFNNFQIFGPDLSLLTFVGRGGKGPGQFEGASGIDIQGDRIAVVDQVGQRLQIFRYIERADGE